MAVRVFFVAACFIWQQQAPFDPEILGLLLLPICCVASQILCALFSSAIAMVCATVATAIRGRVIPL